jgi:hypothetical protein
MWKLLSGIALILVLDVVFIWMMASEPDAPEIARAVGPTAAVPVIHEQKTAAPQTVDDSIEPHQYDAENVTESRSFRAPKRHTIERVRRFDNGSASAAVTAPVKLFQDTIIWIGRTEVPVKIDREPVAVRSEIPTPDEVQTSVSDVEPREVKKRSFQSKALGVIRKPYDLIKAFADKLN